MEYNGGFHSFNRPYLGTMRACELLSISCTVPTRNCIRHLGRTALISDLWMETFHQLLKLIASKHRDLQLHTSHAMQTESPHYWRKIRRSHVTISLLIPVQHGLLTSQHVGFPFVSLILIPLNASLTLNKQNSCVQCKLRSSSKHGGRGLHGRSPCWRSVAPGIGLAGDAK